MFGYTYTKLWSLCPFTIMGVWLIFAMWQPYLFNDIKNVYYSMGIDLVDMLPHMPTWMHAYVLIHACTYTYRLMYVWLHTYLNVYIDICMDAHRHVYIHTCVCIHSSTSHYIHTHIHRDSCMLGTDIDRPTMVCLPTYKHHYTQKFMHVCLHIHIHIYIQHAWIHTYLHAYNIYAYQQCTNSWKCVHALIHIYIHTFIYAYIHACMSTYIYIHV